MITEITMPPILNPAYNPIGIVLETDNLLTAAGVAGEYKFGFIGGVAAGSTIEFFWQDNAVTFTWAAVPDATGTQLTEYTSGSLIAWAQVLIADMRRNYVLQRDFEITYAGAVFTSPTISLKARATGSAYDVTVGVTPMMFAFRAQTFAVDEVRRDRFRVIVHIQQEMNYGGEDWSTAVILDPTPDSSNRVQLDVAEVCRSYIAPDMPPFALAIAIRAEAMRRRFRIQYAERFGDPAQYMALGTSDPFHAVLAGIDASKWPGYLWPIKNKFLSTWPVNREKPVTEMQHEYLYFLLDDASTTLLDLVAVVTWDDATTTTATMATTGALANRDIWIFPAGFEQLGLAALEPTKTATGYTLQLVDQLGANASELRMYTLDRHDWPEYRQLLCRNSLGGLETLPLTGLQLAETEAERLVTERVLPLGYGTGDAQYASRTQRLSRTVTARTGYTTPDVGSYYQDMIVRAELYELRSDRYVPCVIDTTKALHQDDERDLWGMEIKYRLAYDLKSFTP